MGLTENCMQLCSGHDRACGRPPASLNSRVNHVHLQRTSPQVLPLILAEAETAKRRCLYVNSRSHVIKCLEWNRACKSLLGRNANIGRRFAETYPASMLACEYFLQKGSEVDIIELHNLQALDANLDATTSTSQT